MANGVYTLVYECSCQRFDLSTPSMRKVGDGGGIHGKNWGKQAGGGGENDDGNRGYLWHCQSTASAKIRFCNFLIKI